MIIRTPSTPLEVEATLRRWIQPDRGMRSWREGWLAWIEGRPATFVGWVDGDRFQLREWESPSRYVWCPVATGQIVPTGWGTELHITMRPWSQDLILPVTFLVMGSYAFGRFDSAMPLLVAVAMVATLGSVGWAIGRRRIYTALRSRLAAEPPANWL